MICDHILGNTHNLQQFWRQDLCCCRTTSLKQSAAQSQTMWAVMRPVKAVTEEIFIRTVDSGAM